MKHPNTSARLALIAVPALALSACSQLGPKPAGLASGEPAGAMLTGACTPAGPGDAWAKLGAVAGGVDGNPSPASGLAGPEGLPVCSWGVSPGRAEKNAVEQDTSRSFRHS